MDIEATLDTLKAIVSPGLVAFIITATQFFLMLWSKAKREEMSDYFKMGLAVFIGTFTPALGAYITFAQYGTELPGNVNSWVILIIIGLVNGIVAAGSVGFGFKVVKNVRARNVVNASSGGVTYGSSRDESGMIE